MNIPSLLNALPGAVAQGLIWGIMAIGVYITYKVLDLADLTVDGTMATGGAVCVMLMLNGVNVWLALLCAVLAGMLAGLMTGIFHTAMGIPPILSGILTQLSLYSINLAIMGFKANQGINVTKYALIVSQRNVRALDLSNPIFTSLIVLVLVIAVLYWFFGTELGSALRATGANAAMSRAQGINTKAKADAAGRAQLGSRAYHRQSNHGDTGGDQSERNHPASGRAECEKGAGNLPSGVSDECGPRRPGGTGAGVSGGQRADGCLPGRIKDGRS